MQLKIGVYISDYLEGFEKTFKLFCTNEETDESLDIPIYNMENILGWFGQPGQYLKKKFGADYEQFLKRFFLFSWAKKIFENIVLSALRSCIE